LRETGGDELLDGALACASCGVQQFTVVLESQVRGQESQGAQVQGPVGQHADDDRVAFDRPCSHDAVIRGLLGKSQCGAAVREERRKAEPEVQPPGVELREVDNEFNRDVPLGGSEALDLSIERGVGQSRRICEPHAS
jgi:hypothetical protein